MFSHVEFQVAMQFHGPSFPPASTWEATADALYTALLYEERRGGERKSDDAGRRRHAELQRGRLSGLAGPKKELHRRMRAANQAAYRSRNAERLREADRLRDEARRRARGVPARKP